MKSGPKVSEAKAPSTTVHQKYASIDAKNDRNHKRAMTKIEKIQIRSSSQCQMNDDAMRPGSFLSDKMINSREYLPSVV